MEDSERSAIHYGKPMAKMAYPRFSILDLRLPQPVLTSRWLWRAAPAALAGGLALVPAAARACSLTDPGCYIDDFAHQQIRELAVSIWQINRAGLVLARWVEDLRTWLAETVLVDAFTSLVGPVRWMFYLALIIAWMIFVISFMVQALVDLRWVDLRRAAGPILLALLVFAQGGALLQQSERIRLIGSGLLQGVAQSAVLGSIPAISMINSGDLSGELTALYARPSACGTPARAVQALALNDYDAYYLRADANDIHCAEALGLATDFRATFFGSDSIADLESWDRRSALSDAAQGGLRQITGLFMTAGALIEQLMHLLFALALALVWFGLLLSLVFAVFLPSEALFAHQLRALLIVMRASWLASFLLGLGLAILSTVAASGNGFLLLICGLVLIAVCLWQCRQALSVLQAAASSANAAMAGAPQAVGGMLRGWATTGALVAGVAATGGGIGPALSQVGATMARRMGRQAGGNPLARAAGRVLSRRVADRLDALTTDQQLAHEADLSQAEAVWYERLPADVAPADAPARAGAARRKARSQRAQLLDRRAARARQRRDFALADQLRRAATELRPRASIDAPASAAAPPAELPGQASARQAGAADPARPLRAAQLASVQRGNHRASENEAMQTKPDRSLRVVRRSARAHDRAARPLAVAGRLPTAPAQDARRWSLRAQLLSDPHEITGAAPEPGPKRSSPRSHVASPGEPQRPGEPPGAQVLAAMPPLVTGSTIPPLAQAPAELPSVKRPSSASTPAELAPAALPESALPALAHPVAPLVDAYIQAEQSVAFFPASIAPVQNHAQPAIPISPAPAAPATQQASAESPVPPIAGQPGAHRAAAQPQPASAVASTPAPVAAPARPSRAQAAPARPGTNRAPATGAPPRPPASGAVPALPEQAPAASAALPQPWKRAKRGDA